MGKRTSLSDEAFPVEDTSIIRQRVNAVLEENRVVSHILQATVNPGGRKIVLIVTRSAPRAERLRRLLVERGLCDAVSIVSSESAARSIILGRACAFVLAEEEFAGACRDALQSRSGRLCVLEGEDDGEDAVLAVLRAPLGARVDGL